MSVDGRLKARLAEQLKSESETIQGATQEQLNAMRSELSSIYSGVLSTIEADMRGQSQVLAKRLRRLMLLPSLALVMISLAISAGAWAWTHYQWTQIQQHQEALANMKALGVEPVRQSDGKEFLLLPEGMTLGDLRQTDSGQWYVQILRQ